MLVTNEKFSGAGAAEDRRAGAAELKPAAHLWDFAIGLLQQTAHRERSNEPKERALVHPAAHEYDEEGMPRIGIPSSLLRGRATRLCRCRRRRSAPLAGREVRAAECAVQVVGVATELVIPRLALPALGRQAEADRLAGICVGLHGVARQGSGGGGIERLGWAGSARRRPQEVKAAAGDMSSTAAASAASRRSGATAGRRGSGRPPRASGPAHPHGWCSGCGRRRAGRTPTPARRRPR
jgi:hypothetical protein